MMMIMMMMMMMMMWMIRMMMMMMLMMMMKVMMMMMMIMMMMVHVARHGLHHTLFTPDEVTMEKFTPDKADKGLHQRRVYTRHRLHQTPSIHQTRFTPDVVYTRQGQ